MADEQVHSIGAQLERLEREFAAFRETVHRVTSEVKHDYGWSDESFNRVMRELGLPLFAESLDVNFSLEVQVLGVTGDPGQPKEEVVQEVMDRLLAQVNQMAVTRSKVVIAHYITGTMRTLRA